MRLMPISLLALLYQLPDAPPPPKLPPPPLKEPLSLELLLPDHKPPPLPPPTQPPPLPPADGEVMPSLNIVKADAKRPAKAEMTSDPKMNQAINPISPPVAT